MATDVGQLLPLPDDGCDVEQINDEEVLRRMWQAAEDFGRKKEIRARMYKLREKRLREFYTTGEVLKDVQSADPHAAIREETPKRGGTTYRELVVGELRAGDHFDIREKPVEQTKSELIETSDGSHHQQIESVTVIFDSTTTVVSGNSTTIAVQETTRTSSNVESDMLDSKSSPEVDSPSVSRTSSRRSSKSSPSRNSDSRRSSTNEIKLTPSPNREIKCTTETKFEMSESNSSSRRMSETRVSSTPPREVISSRRSSATKMLASSPTRSSSSEAGSPTREVPSRKSSISEKRTSPAKEISRKSSVSSETKESSKEKDTQFSTFTSVTLVRQQEGARVTSPNRRKLSSAGSKARRAGTPSASPPCSPTHDEKPEDSSDDEIATVRSKVEDATKPKSILRTPEQRKKSITEVVESSKVGQKASSISIQKVVQQEVREIKKPEVKRAVAEVKLERKTEVTKRVVQTEKPIKEQETKKEVSTRTLRRRSREQVEDSSERDSSCSPVRTRTLSKSKVSPKQEITATTTSTLKRPTKLPMLNSKKPEAKVEDRCCGRKHGAASPDKPWRQSPVQSPKKASPTGKVPQKANRSPSISPERPARTDSRPAKRSLVPALSIPTKRTVESPTRRPVTDRAATTTCIKTPEKNVTSRLTARSVTSPIKSETNRFQRKPAETTPVKKTETTISSTTTSVRKAAIPTYQKTQASRTTVARFNTTTTTSTLRQTQQQKNTTLRNGRSLSGSKITESPKIQKAEVQKQTLSHKEPAPAVTISQPVESEEESAGFSTEEDETVTELEDIRYSSANLLDTEDEESSSRRLLAQGQTQIQQLSRDSSPEGRPQRFADRVSEPESDFESTMRERTPLEVVVPPGGLEELQEEEGENEEQQQEPALLSVADKANIFLTTDLGKVEKKKQVFETNKAVSLAKAVFERNDDDQEEARKKYERDILSRPSVFSKVTDRIRNFDLQSEEKGPEKELPNEPIKEQPNEPIKNKEPEIREPVVEEPVKSEKVVPLCEEQPQASVSRASGKFGVTLRRTNSKIGDSIVPPKEQERVAEVKPVEVVAVEKQTEVDVRQLEIMLEKATNYDERRRLRAAIRDAKKTQTIFTTTSITKVASANVTRKTSPTRQVNGRRSVSPVKSESGRKNSSPGRKQQQQPEEVLDGNAISTPFRAAEELKAPKPELTKQQSAGKLDRGKLANFQKEENSTSVVTIKRKVSSETESVRKISAPPREANPTDSVTSSYGVGPLDESGRPLFGLRALRRTQEPVPTSLTEVVDRSAPAKQEVTDLSGRPLFGGLRALKKEAVSSIKQEKETVEDITTSSEEMPELQPSTGQLKSLVDRHEQNTKCCTTAVSPDSVQKPKAKLRDTFLTQESRSKIAAETQKASKSGALVNQGDRTNSLKAIIKKHESSQEIITAPVEPVRKISTDQVKSILKKPRESTPEATVVSSASISLRKDSIERRPGDFEQESIVEDEDGGRTVVKSVHRERNEGDMNTSFSSTSRSHVSGDGSHLSSHNSSTMVTTTSRDSENPISMGRVGRSGSVRALQQKFQQTAMESSSPVPRSLLKAGLIFRTNSFKHDNNGDLKQSGGDSKEACEEIVQRTEKVPENDESVEHRVTEARVVSESSTSSNSRSFLGNNSKVTGVQDVLSRMREADNDQAEDGWSPEDREAKALLNKFLGASVLMQGIEPLLQAQSSSALVSQIEKQRLAIAQEETFSSAASNNIEELTDQAQLRKLLDAATDYDSRRQIRARLRTLMADNKVTDSSDGVADSASRSLHGELLPMAVDQLMASLEQNFNPVVNNGGDGGGNGDGDLGDLQECDGPAVDSGTESGEDPRTPNSQSQVDLAPQKKPAELPPEVLDEVLGALAKLQGTLQMAAGEDVEPERKEAILSLVTRLQGSLPLAEKAPQPAPRRKKSRHTVGVTEGDLDGARRLADEVPFSPLRPSDFNARVAKEDYEPHDPVNALTLKRPLHRRSFSQGSQRKSLVDDPSQIILFTPEQSVQIAVHKAAINKQLSQEEDNRRNQQEPELKRLLGENKEGSVEAELRFPDTSYDVVETPGDVRVENKVLAIKSQPVETVFPIEKPKPILRMKSLEEHGSKPLTVFQNQELKAPEMVKVAVKEEPKPVDVVKPVVQPKLETPKSVLSKPEPISKPIFATQEPPKPVFSKNELPKPVAPPKQIPLPRPDPQNAAKPFVKPKVEPVEAKPPILRAPSEPPKPPVKPITAVVLEFQAQDDEEPKPSGVLWGSICQSAKEHGDRKIVSRAEKKRKLKRANTIDIPKPFDMQDMQDSGDDDEGDGENSGMPQKASLEVPFVAKTENDRKFLAFLENKSPKENLKPTICASGGIQWNNRFSNLKTNFEKTDAEKASEKKEVQERPVSAVKRPEVVEVKPVLRKQSPKANREVYEQRRKSSLPTVNGPPKKDQLPWAGANDSNVIVGSLTVLQNQNVQQKKQIFAKTVALEPNKPQPELRKPMPPMIKSQTPVTKLPQTSVAKTSPLVETISQKEEQLLEIQRQQQLKFLQQKEEQDRYRRQLRLQQEVEGVRGPAPIGHFNHAQNSAFRPLAKQKQQQATAQPMPPQVHDPVETPRIEYSASVATETRQLNMRIYKDKKDKEEELQEVEAPLTMMTAVSRVKEGPRCQQATVVQGQVQRRDSPSRSSLAKSHLRSILPDSPMSLTRSSHSTSDMMDLAFQARFDASAASSRCSSITRPESPLLNDEVLSMKFEFPLHQASPLPFSPPTQRRTFQQPQHQQQSYSPLRKSESSHQIGQHQRPQSLLSVPTTPPLRRSPSGAKIHLFSKQYEAQFTSDNVEDKQRQVMAYLGDSPSKSPARSPRPMPIAYNRQDTLRGIVHDDDLENVDEEFERLFESAVRPKVTAPVRVRLSHSVPSSPTGKKSEFSMTSSSTSTIQLDGGTKISSVSSTMTSNTRVSKAPPSKLKMSPFDKFRQLDEQNSSPSPSTPKTPGGSISGPLFKFTDAGLNRSASNVKERLLYWCQVKTKEYKDLKIENFSTSWNNGMAFCALIHHFYPDAFNYEELRPESRRKNFELAFRVAEEKADIAPLLDVDDMVMMKKPDWKCVFTYVQSIYRRFKDED